MRHVRQLSVCTILCTAAVLPAVDIPAPAPMPDAQAFALLVVPDLKATIGRIEAAGKAIGAPVQPGMLAMAAGAQLGDPGLTRLGQGPTYAIVAPGMPMPVWAVVLPMAQPGEAAQALAAAGMNAQALDDGHLAICDLVGGADLAKRVAPQIAGLAKSMPAGTDIRLLLAPSRALVAYGPLLEMGLMQGAQQASQGPQPMAGEVMRLATGLWPLVAATVDSFESHQIDVRFAAQGLEIDAVTAAKPGSALAKGLIAPVGALPDTSRFGPGAAIVSITGRINPALYGACADLCAATAKAQPKVAALITPEVIALIRDSGTNFDGSFAGRSGFGEHPHNQEMQAGVADAAKAQALFSAGFRLLTQGAIGKMAGGMGMAYEVTEGARTGAAGARIDRMRIVATPEAKPEMVEMVKLMPTMEFTAVGKAVSMATDPANLDALLAGKPRGGVPPKSVAGIGAGWDLYCDMDLCRSTRLQGEQMAKSNPQLAGVGGMFAALKDGDVILSALAIRDGRVRGRVVVPYAMGKQFTAMGKAAGRRRAAPEEPVEPAPGAEKPGVF